MCDACEFCGERLEKCVCLDVESELTDAECEWLDAEYRESQEL